MLLKLHGRCSVKHIALLKIEHKIILSRNRFLWYIYDVEYFRKYKTLFCRVMLCKCQGCAQYKRTGESYVGRTELELMLFLEDGTDQVSNF